MKKKLENLIKQGVLQKEKGIGFDQIRKRMSRAEVDLNNAKLLIKTDETGAYRMAYDAMLQAGISLILLHGFRPKISGFHKTVAACVKEILGEQFSVLTKKFDQMRRNRNDAIYDIGIISRGEAEEAIRMAENFIQEAVDYIKNKNPQKELF